MNSYHIIYRGSKGWSLDRTSAKRALKLFEDKLSAVVKGKELARKNGATLFSHDRDGRVIERFDYAS